MAKRIVKAEFALAEICERYPMINKWDIEAFGPVFYPIARIEADMEEKSFEDFDGITESVLRFISLGIKDAPSIAELMALTPDYISGMQKMLLSYGHIDNTGTLTALGRESLDAGRKVTVAHTKQIFLLDAINCNIVRVDADLDKSSIERPADVPAEERFVAFIEHAAGISKAEVEKTLKESQYNTLKRIPGGMNINVTAITDIRCLGIKYIKSYLLKLKGQSPYIFVKRYDYRAKGKEKYFWLPFSVDSEEARGFLNCGNVPVHGRNAKLMLEDVFKRMTEGAASDRMPETLTAKKTFFCENLFKLSPEYKGNDVLITGASLTEYSKNILRLLYGIGKDGIYYIVDDALSGIVLRILPGNNDPELLRCAALTVKALDKYKRDKVDSYIRERITGEETITKELIKILDGLGGN